MITHNSLFFFIASTYFTRYWHSHSFNCEKCNSILSSCHPFFTFSNKMVSLLFWIRALNQSKKSLYLTWSVTSLPFIQLLYQLIIPDHTQITHILYECKLIIMEDAFLPVYSKVMYYSIGSGRSYNYNVNAISLKGMPMGVVGASL